MPHTTKKSHTEKVAERLSLRRALLRRQSSLHARRRIEQSLIIAALRDELGELGLHPNLPSIVGAKWPYATIDDSEMPKNWIKKAAGECRSVLRQYPWTPPRGGDSQAISIEALEAVGSFLRELRKLAGVEQ